MQQRLSRNYISNPDHFSPPRFNNGMGILPALIAGGAIVGGTIFAGGKLADWWEQYMTDVPTLEPPPRPPFTIPSPTDSPTVTAQQIKDWTPEEQLKVTGYQIGIGTEYETYIRNFINPEGSNNSSNGNSWMIIAVLGLGATLLLIRK